MDSLVTCMVAVNGSNPARIYVYNCFKPKKRKNSVFRIDSEINSRTVPSELISLRLCFAKKLSVQTHHNYPKKKNKIFSLLHSYSEYSHALAHAYIPST